MDLSTSFNNFKYEHFPIVCPTCEGTGKRYPDMSKEMVTFIPVKDKRLRPAYIKLKIFLLTFFLISIGGTTIYFIYPRDIKFCINDLPDLKNFTFTSSNSSMIYKAFIFFKNNNYYSVHIYNGTVQLSYNEFVVAVATIPPMVVGLRKEVNMPVNLEAVYDEDAGKHINKVCYNNRSFFGQDIQMSAAYSSWIHSDHISGENFYFYVDCSYLIFPMPTKNPVKN
ncbi:transmembrane protein 106B isoform X2 [Hydra vulgaris]|uniref:Transmembrane protein 106B isoform X2 n=1 Tax=Hydra vulgaris TaxID=6087 RepID=A0ABM4CSX6_HYDVU